MPSAPLGVITANAGDQTHRRDSPEPGSTALRAPTLRLTMTRLTFLRPSMALGGPRMPLRGPSPARQPPSMPLPPPSLPRFGARVPLRPAWLPPPPAPPPLPDPPDHDLPVVSSTRTPYRIRRDFNQQDVGRLELRLGLGHDGSPFRPTPGVNAVGGSKPHRAQARQGLQRNLSRP
jgi:hypothetical protein